MLTPLITSHLIILFSNKLILFLDLQIVCFITLNHLFKISQKNMITTPQTKLQNNLIFRSHYLKIWYGLDLIYICLNFLSLNLKTHQVHVWNSLSLKRNHFLNHCHILTSNFLQGLLLMVKMHNSSFDLITLIYLDKFLQKEYHHHYHSNLLVYFFLLFSKNK